jgi:DNA polymerase-3 subunit beta
MIIDSKQLAVALGNLKPLISARNTLPILSCVHIGTDKGRLRIAATNLDEYAIELVDADGELESVCVNFWHLSMAISGKETEITMAKKGVAIKCGDDETILGTQESSEFPEVMAMKDAKTHGVSCPDLAASIKSVGWAASTDTTRYILNSVYIVSKAKSLDVISTNGRELAIASTPLIGSEFDFVFPSPFISNFVNALARPGAILSTTENHASVTHDAGQYVSKLVEGNYPNYKMVIPANVKPLGTVSVEEFLGVMSSCVGYAVEQNESGTFRFSKTGLVVSMTIKDGPQLTRHLLGAFVEFNIALSVKKTQNIFRSIKTEEAKIFYVDELSPIIFESGNLRVLMTPMRMS